MGESSLHGRGSSLRLTQTSGADQSSCKGSHPCCMATARRKQLMAACALRGDRGLGQVCRLLHEASARDLEYVGEEGYGLLDIAALYGSPRVCEVGKPVQLGCQGVVRAAGQPHACASAA